MFLAVWHVNHADIQARMAHDLANPQASYHMYTQICKYSNAS